ncbi:MAG TPA: hypothetical protein VF613_03655 [Longimicrobium sp.]|jgi:hypothetical protein
MAAIVGRVLLAVAAGVGFCLYAVVLGVVAAPMLIVTALRFPFRHEPAAPEPAEPLQIMRLDGVTIRQREEASV